MAKVKPGSLARIAARMSAISHFPNAVSIALYAANLEALKIYREHLAFELERISSTSRESHRLRPSIALGRTERTTSWADLNLIQNAIRCGSATGLSRLKVSGDGISESEPSRRANANTED